MSPWWTTNRGHTFLRVLIPNITASRWRISFRSWRYLLWRKVRLNGVDNFENRVSHGQNLDFCPLCKHTLRSSKLHSSRQILHKYNSKNTACILSYCSTYLQQPAMFLWPFPSEESQICCYNHIYYPSQSAETSIVFVFTLSTTLIPNVQSFHFCPSINCHMICHANSAASSWYIDILSANSLAILTSFEQLT